MPGSAMAAELHGRQLPSGRPRRRGRDARVWSPSVLEHHGRLDVLVNNAGESIRIPHADLKAATPAVWRRMLDINLIAPFVLIAEAEPALRKSAESGGRPASSISAPMPACGPRARRSPTPRPRPACITPRALLALALGPAIRVNCRGARAWSRRR